VYSKAQTSSARAHQCITSANTGAPLCRKPDTVCCCIVGALDSALDKGYRIARPPILTSQYCMAVSIDTCFAVARFFGWFWRVNSQYVTPGFPKTWNTPGLFVRCVTHLCTLYTVPRQHWANRRRYIRTLLHDNTPFPHDASATAAQLPHSAMRW
jgi:hypothetical protein